MDIFILKSGDTSPSLRYALLPDDINLAGASIRFQMRRIDGPTTIDALATIFAEQPPVVQYDWQPGDTLEGDYHAEFRVTYPDGAIETFPNNGFIKVVCIPNVPGL